MILFQSTICCKAVNEGETHHWHRVKTLGGMNDRYLAGSGLRWNGQFNAQCQCNGGSTALPLLAVHLKGRSGV